MDFHVFRCTSAIERVGRRVEWGKGQFFRSSDGFSRVKGKAKCEFTERVIRPS